jgi:menaquinone-dependent protoporphyrinogen oxidase
MHVLVASQTQHGSTREIADLIGATLAARGIETDIRDVENVHDLASYDAVVLGSAVYMGSWTKPAKVFVERHADELRSRPTWLFSSGPVGEPPKNGRAPVQVDDLVAAAHPRGHRLFGGRLQRSRLGMFERAVAHVVRAPEGDFRDWAEIEDWATGIADELQPDPLGDG